MKPDQIRNVLFIAVIAISVYVLYNGYRLQNALERIQDSICDNREQQCRTDCDQVRDMAILAVQQDSSSCAIAHVQDHLDCFLQNIGNAEAERQCRLRADQQFQECLTHFNAVKQQAIADHAACVQACAEAATECRQRDLLNSALNDGPQLPDREDFEPVLVPPGGPKP